MKPYFTFLPSGQVTHYNETALHIFSIQVGHPLQRDRFSHSFHLGRSPITMRSLFTHFLWFWLKEVARRNLRQLWLKGIARWDFRLTELHTFSLVLVKGGRQKGSQVALIKGNRQMGFQVDRATHILWFWLKEVARRDLRQLWLKGITRWDFRLTELHTFFGFG